MALGTLQERPGYPPALRTMARLLMQKDDYAPAVALLQQAIASRTLADTYGFTDVDGTLPDGPLEHRPKQADTASP